MLDNDSVIALAVAHRLGRTMKPLGLDTGDVFVTDQSYRTGELMAFAESLVAAERERCAELCKAYAVRHAKGDHNSNAQAWMMLQCAAEIRGL